MKTKILTLVLSALCCCAVSAFAQDASLYQKYAKKGDTDAMYNLANCYWYGNGGVSQDYSSAAFWYEKAAKKNPYAMFMTAYCYLYGVGVTKNYKLSLNYAQKAIKEGLSSGSWIKAQLYREGYPRKSSWDYFDCLLDAAIGGYVVAQNEVGLLLLNGSEEYSVTKNQVSAFGWFKKSAEKGDAEGLYYLALCYDYGYGTNVDKEKALSNYIKSANLGYPQAEAYVGYFYMYGLGVEVNYSTAYNYLKPAADQGNAFAYGKIGDLYYYGLGVDENNNTALDMYKKAAELGDAYSMCQLAYMYGYGIGASEDKSLMYKYYKRASDLNYAAGQRGLGDCYINGYGVEKDASSAFYWYKKAAEQEDGMSMYYLSLCYYNGMGTSKDLSQYISYLKKAADNGVTRAIVTLGCEYFYGDNISQDLGKALDCFKNAAEDGDAFSQSVLGYDYYKGEELCSKKDYNQAFKYLNMAVNNSYFKNLDEDEIADIYHCLAGCYRYGRGTEPDQSLASYYTEQAAKYGNADSKRASNVLRSMHGYNGSQNISSESINSSTTTRNLSTSDDYTSSSSKKVDNESSQYFVLKKPVQNNNWSTYATSEAMDLYNRGVEAGRQGNYSAAYDFYLRAYKGGCDIAANNLALLYAYGRGVKKDTNMARFYVDIALRNFKDKNLIYPMDGGFWYADVLDTKGEICVVDNDWDEAMKILIVLGETEDARDDETPFIKAMMDKLYVGSETYESATAKYNFNVNAPLNAIETAEFKWEVLYVGVNENATYINKRVTPQISSSWINSTSSEFIEDAETGKRYYIKSSSIEMSPNKTYLTGTSPKDFTETYPALPATVRYINISSGASYYVKNLKIR